MAKNSFGGERTVFFPVAAIFQRYDAVLSIASSVEVIVWGKYVELMH